MDIMRYKIVIEAKGIRHVFDYGENRARAKRKMQQYEERGWKGYIYNYSWKEREDHPTHSFTYYVDGKRHKTKEIDMCDVNTRAAKLTFIAHHMREYYKVLKGEERDEEEEFTDPECWINNTREIDFLWWYLDPGFERRMYEKERENKDENNK